MSFVSYAQNFEDVMLWRALKHVQNGFYIDVGAAWPDEHSVTKAFYLSGWRGINIEPNPQLNQRLCEQRPEDKNLMVAVGDREECILMNFIEDTGLSTLSAEIAQSHRKSGWAVNQRAVQLTTLAKICAENVPAGQEIHFLKVDVEGFEEAALRGNDWVSYKPWVVLVEAALPTSQTESYGAWEPMLLSAGYRFAYADGLNRFYVASGHLDLLPALKFPPNVFDGFVLHAQVQADTKALRAEARATQAEAQATQAEAQATQAEARATQAEARATQVIGELGSAFKEANEQRARAEARVFLLQDELINARTKIEQLCVQLGQSQADLAHAQGVVNDVNSALIVAKRQRQQAEGHAEQLRDELLAAMGRIEEYSGQLGATQAQLECMRQDIEQFTAALDSAADQKSELQARAQWLQNEWDAARAKINEINLAAHHWWSVSDSLGQELKRIYASRSWRITEPLRAASRSAKAFAKVPSFVVLALKTVARRLIKPLVVWAMKKALARPLTKVRVMKFLANYPETKRHLRLLAIRSGLLVGASIAEPPLSSVATAEIAVSPETYKKTMYEPSPLLPSHAGGIYVKLRKAVESRGK